MNDASKNTAIANDDIDLLLLLERILIFLKRFRWIFIIAVLCGLLSGLFVYKYLSKIYSSTMVIHSFLLTNQEEIEIVDNWNNLLGKKEYKALAVSLNCNENIFHHLKKLKAEEIQKVFTGINPHGFSIGVNVTDNAILNELQKGLVYGFENSPYVRQRLDARNDKLKILIKETGAEIQQLDSTKKIMENILAGKTKITSSLIIDVSTINRQLIEMNEKLLAYKDDLKFNNAVQVLQGFSKFRRPTGPKLIPWLIIGLAFFLSFASIYTLISSVRAKIIYRAMAANKISDNDPATPI